MGHLAGKEIYKQLGKKIDGLTVRAPWNSTFHEILKILYTAEEAAFLIKMPFGFSSFEKIQQISGYSESALKKLLHSLCSKGLVMDIKMRRSYRYTISPMVIGIFEYTMMRIGGNTDLKKISKLFHQYMIEDPSFYQANFDDRKNVSMTRTIPHDGVIDDDITEVLDYEKAESVIKQAKKYAIGTCSCRHEMLHLDKKECNHPLESCVSFGLAADFLIRNKLAREATETEILENLARSKESGLALSGDNVSKNISFICHCCGCCCHLMLGISQTGYPGTVVSSNYIAEINDNLCTGCGKCAKACPIKAIEMKPDTNQLNKKKRHPVINLDICLGCGVCAL
ncbi:MAG: 4Fe-4S dicluster domain-containing protein, partial [Fibrobacteria bacterium]|nr:4Fe-4S dicluster domain-containing protein [Fibrobacteria bacterium]